MKLWVSSGAFLLGWLLTCLVLRPFQPMAEVPQVKEKLVRLGSAGAEYDTLFLGSSRVRRHLSPAIFDATMRERGLQTKSFNLGIDGMTFPELAYVLKQCLQTAQHPLRYVIIDVNPLRRRMMKGSDLHSLREIHWHDLAHTAQVWEAVLGDYRSGKESARKTVELLATHAMLLARHYSSTGRGADLLPFRLGAAKQASLEDEFAREGFYPVTTVMSAKVRATYLPELDRMLASKTRPARGDNASARALDNAARAIRSAGATPIFVLSPVIAMPVMARPSSELHPPPAVVAFDEPRLYPELFLPENRYDRQHLNLVGAKLLTRLLAREVAALAESGSAR